MFPFGIYAINPSSQNKVHIQSFTHLTHETSEFVSHRDVALHMRDLETTGKLRLEDTVGATFFISATFSFTVTLKRALTGVCIIKKSVRNFSIEGLCVGFDRTGTQASVSDFDRRGSPQFRSSLEIALTQPNLVIFDRQALLMRDPWNPVLQVEEYSHLGVYGDQTCCLFFFHKARVEVGAS